MLTKSPRTPVARPRSSSNDTKKDLLPFRAWFSALSGEIPHALAMIVSSMPRGGLQVVQPAGLPEEMLHAYVRHCQDDDRATWRAIVTRRPTRAVESWGRGEFAHSEMFTRFMQPVGLAHLLAVYIDAPVFDGYGGAVHLYRTADQGDFRPAEIDRAVALVARLETAVRRARAARQSRDCQHRLPWEHVVPVRQLIFDGQMKQRLPAGNVNTLDDRVRAQLVERAGQTERLDGQSFEADRLVIPDSHSDLWIFHAVVYREYPALGPGPVRFFCMPPDPCDWEALRAEELAADEDIARLVPAIHYMRQHFRQGPTLNDVAEIVDMSPFHFHRRFSLQLGVTPKEFMLDCQIHAAKMRLSARDQGLAEIARDCGFSHQSHFTSRFKQSTGLTPTRWRRICGSKSKALQS